MGCRRELKWVSVEVSPWRLGKMSVQSQCDHGGVKCQFLYGIGALEATNGNPELEETIKVALSTGVAEIV